MKDESSIFDAEPENLDRLVFEILGDSGSEEDSNSAATLNGVLEQPGSLIGRYKLLSVLGEGGMGIVYLAEQQEPIRRKVALKVIKPGMDSKAVIARFEAERQALALLEHPNIAHVHDAGTTETGRPYFVMEFVKGLPITEHCDLHKLTIEERLQLLQQVCQAVQHAHQKGIIHRDIKPSNILVSMEGDRVVSKIIDFGVAKALAHPLTERTLATEDSQLLGTPEYMSPEQADMATEDIDTRSDIYSLGVLLYVLLTGVLPFDSNTLREGGIENIRKTIRETNPKTPSTRLAKLGDEARKVAENRRTEIHTLARHLKKELEWIPLKAMRKERSERYRSASELADDIENYLNGIPLIAGPTGTGYKVKKFVRRNRVLVGSIAAAVVVLVVGVMVSTVFAVGQARARTEAERQTRISEAVSNFLRNDLLASVDPSKAKGRELTIRSFLANASESLQDRFHDEPLVEASIRTTLGWTYRMLGDLKAAEPHLARALQIRKEQLGQEHPETLETMGLLFWVYGDRGRYGQARQLGVQELEISRRIFGDEHPTTLEYMQAVGYAYIGLGRYDEAEQLYARTAQILRRVPGEPHPWSGYLGQLRQKQGRYDEAEALVLEQLGLWETNDENPYQLSYMSLLAEIYRRQGRYKESESQYLKTLEMQRRVLGDEHSYTLSSMQGLARLYTDEGRYSEAEQQFVEALETCRRVRREDHPATLGNVNDLAVLRTKQKQYDQAEILFDEALKGRRRELGNDHPDTLQTFNDFGVLRREQGQYEEAARLLNETLEGRKTKLGPDHPDTLGTMHELAVLYKQQERYEEAEELLRKVIEGRRLKLGETHPHTLESMKNLIALYEAWGKPEQAEKWRAKLPCEQGTEKQQ
jgi:serine/threonine protein kinase/tetratricopeptide (TPR) repeat protein